MRGLDRLVLFGATDALIKLSDAGVGSICSLVKSINNVGVVSISAAVESIITLVVAIDTILELSVRQLDRLVY